MTEAPHRTGDGPIDTSCLHCVINYALRWWAKQNTPGITDASGEVRYSLTISRAIPKICDVIGELIYVRLAEQHRASFERYAHECLEAAFEHQRTGKPIAVSVNPNAKPS